MVHTRGPRMGVKLMQEQLEAARQEKDWYTVQQLYKTLYARYLHTNQTSEIGPLLRDGVCTLLDNKEIASGSELALLLIRYLSERRIPPESPYIDYVLEIASHYPKGNRHPSKVMFIREAVKWSKAPENRNQGDPLLHAKFADMFRKDLDYKAAQAHYLRSHEPQSLASMLHEWKELGHPSERDLFPVRALLQYLVLGDLSNARLMFQAYTEGNTDEATWTPLMNFAKLLLQALEQKDLNLFNRLRDEYAKSIQRDPIFARYLDEVARVFYGVKKPVTGLGELVGEFLEMMNTKGAQPGDDAVYNRGRESGPPDEKLEGILDLSE
ncbi:Golgi to ER traffic protein 4 homolog isoform X1 [Schistocerca gregaria]|uniref:Golgi to ER traffic protein 4 homolog isoform X1 n=1 Tax=Schistocerca gregaria TaxID=7010 RepID=UPI00211DF4F6|nr:Golgi to ER traffic protein 4 homolog isoform X1 [Schistocerca gregaria]